MCQLTIGFGLGFSAISIPQIKEEGVIQFTPSEEGAYGKFCHLAKLPSWWILVPRVFNIPKVEHDQPCSTLVVLFFKISLFIYVILGPDWSRAKIKVNKQTNLEKQNNQS